MGILSKMPAPQVGPKQHRQIRAPKTDIGRRSQDRSFIVVHQDREIAIGQNPQNRIRPVAGNKKTAVRAEGQSVRHNVGQFDNLFGRSDFAAVLQSENAQSEGG